MRCGRKIKGHRSVCGKKKSRGGKKWDKNERRGDERAPPVWSQGRLNQMRMFKLKHQTKAPPGVWEEERQVWEKMG